MVETSETDVLREILPTRYEAFRSSEFRDADLGDKLLVTLAELLERLRETVEERQDRRRRLVPDAERRLITEPAEEAARRRDEEAAGD
jgi:hypothetical protein